MSTPPARPMPPRPASGGRWVFDPEAWAYVPAPPETPADPPVQTPVEAAPPPADAAPKSAKEPRK